MITIIDYGAGNLRSVQNAFDKIGVKSEVSSNPMKILNAKKIILPGVGAAGEAMANLRRLDLIDPLKIYLRSGRPFLGICLGAQLLLEYSEENETECLGAIKGVNKKFRSKSLSIPQMGWNTVRFKQNRLFQNIPNNSYFYFLNSFYLAPKEKEDMIGETSYGNIFTSAINKKNIYGVQFHPEKSAAVGLQLLNNFINLC